jgi:hypothetical protein
MPSYFLSRKQKSAGFGRNNPANDNATMATITNENITVSQTEIQVYSLPGSVAEIY